MPGVAAVDHRVQPGEDPEKASVRPSEMVSICTRRIGAGTHLKSLPSARVIQDFPGVSCCLLQICRDYYFV